MSKGKAPKAPDYVGAANAQAAASKEVTNIQNFANRPTINTPFGQESWTNAATIDPATGQKVTSWTQNTTLAPGLQAALDAQVGTQLGRSNLANDLMDRAATQYSKPFDTASLPEMASLSTPTMNTDLADYAAGLTTDVPQYQLNAQFDPRTSGLSSNVQQQDIQRSLNAGDNPALPQFDSSYRDMIAQSLMERMNPTHERQKNQIETQLANAGYTVGSEGYTRALADMQGRQAAERYNALDTAGNEAQRLYGMQMGSRQQAFNEDMGMGQFANAAANQAFQQDLSANQFQNQAIGQGYEQTMGAQRAGNEALNQQFGQGLQAGQFGNQSLGQAAAMDQSRMAAINQAQAQQFQMQAQQVAQQNQLRQQAIAEQMQQRNMPLNEMNALLGGQQVSMPQMPNFVPAQQSQTPNILGATQSKYDAQLGAYNAKQAGLGNMVGGLFSLGASAMAPGAGSLFGL